jgi:hypothetical protein
VLKVETPAILRRGSGEAKVGFPGLSEQYWAKAGIQGPTLR